MAATRQRFDGDIESVAQVAVPFFPSPDALKYTLDGKRHVAELVAWLPMLAAIHAHVPNFAFSKLQRVKLFEFILKHVSDA